MPNLVPYSKTVTHSSFADDFTNPPTGKIVLLYGDKPVFRLSLILASHALVKGKPIAVVDGCNRFDVHTISYFARQHQLKPETLLKKIYISRGFTSYQMEAAINDRLMPFLKRIGSNTALIFGMLDTFYDEQVPFREVNNMLKRIITHLNYMKRCGISILITSAEYNVRPKERNQFIAALKNTADTVYRLSETENDSVLFLEKENFKTKIIRTPNHIKSGKMF